ncbi:deoxyribodipyrimidine photo-lyase [Chitinophaga sp.]|uniref:cryptochrome/photolyase family protein n=1 Tax=Chitinophaga sp. TaxID=1869181 RepID=UPI0031D32497
MIVLCWFRRDLRLSDQAALYHALRSGLQVVPVFVFDTNILDDLEEKSDRRVQFIHTALSAMQQQLVKMSSTLHVFHGTPEAAFAYWTQQYPVTAVYTNHDYEPYARRRDAAVEQQLKNKNISFHTYKDQVIFEKNEVTKDNGAPYTVFTPYSRKWKQLLTGFYLQSYPVEQHYSAFYRQAPLPLPALEDLGFRAVENHSNAPGLEEAPASGNKRVSADTGFPPPWPEEALLRHYAQTRDFPAVHGTSRLGVHLRFGTISIRMLARMAQHLSEVYLNELIWREFYQMILWHFPQVENHSFKKEYDAIPWRNNPAEFERWCEGQTGYPIVDAGMRELNATGYMHNRVRMITASFLTKHLLVDWRWGEAYFARKLLDYDLAANNGGWQWAAGSGCDAAPYFRIFNPALQTQRFDKDLQYVRKWVPEVDELTYPRPMVEHEAARKRALEVYSKALGK